MVTLVMLPLLGSACGDDATHDLMRSTLTRSVDPTGDYAEIRGRLQESTTRCMSRAGFDFDAATALPIDVASGTEALPAITGSGAGARYKNPPAIATGDDAAAQTPTESPEYLRTLLGPDDAERVTVQLPEFGEFGTGTEGCLADAYREVIGDDLAFKWQTTEFIVRNLAAPLVAGARQDPAVEAAMRRWSGCMADAGYTLTAPVEAVARSADDEAIAVDDLTCRSSSKLPSVWKDALDRAVGDVDSDLDAYLVFWRDTNAAIVAGTR